MNQSKRNRFYTGGKNKYKNKPFQSKKQEEVENLIGRSEDNDDNDSFNEFAGALTSTCKASDFPSSLYGGSWGRGQSHLRDTMDSYTFALNAFNTNQQEPKKEENPKRIPHPKEIKDFIDQYVIGQEDAKIALSVAVYNHYKRINSKIEDDGIEIQKSNILMIGNSGTGKTLLAQTIAKFLDVPFVSVDATTFTPTGIVGKDVESIVTDLVKAANGDKKKASQGIVYIDEFDKLAGGNSLSKTTSNVKGVLGGDTQASFLKLIEGNEIEAKSDSYSMFGSSSSKLNTKNILFICGGAFAGIEELIEKQEIGKIIGFGVESNKEQIDNMDIWDKIGTEEIIKYGMMPEIVGRLPVILKLRPLEKNDLVNILTKPKNAIVKQYKKLLNMDGICLDFSQDALELIAEMAIANKTGARGLRGILEKVMTKLMFNVPDDEYERKCIITAEHIKNNLIPELSLTVDPELLQQIS